MILSIGYTAVLITALILTGILHVRVEQSTLAKQISKVASNGKQYYSEQQQPK